MYGLLILVQEHIEVRQDYMAFSKLNNNHAYICKRIDVSYNIWYFILFFKYKIPTSTKSGHRTQTINKFEEK